MRSPPTTSSPPCAKAPANCWKTWHCLTSTQGKGIEDGKKSLAFGLRFRAADRTLTADEASAARESAVAVAAERFGAVQR